MAQPAQDRSDAVTPNSAEGRTALAKLVISLFDRWKLPTADQAAMLGLSLHSRATLASYRKGRPLADSRDLLDRAGHLLAIHRSLRILFPRNQELVYQWPVVPNQAFDGKAPVAVIRDEGFLGLLRVRRYLDFARGQ